MGCINVFYCQAGRRRGGSPCAGTKLDRISLCINISIGVNDKEIVRLG